MQKDIAEAEDHCKRLQKVMLEAAWPSMLSSCLQQQHSPSPFLPIVVSVHLEAHCMHVLVNR